MKSLFRMPASVLALIWGLLLAPVAAFAAEGDVVVKGDVAWMLTATVLVIGDVTGKGIPAALYMALSKGLAKSVLTRKRGELADAVVDDA